MAKVIYGRRAIKQKPPLWITVISSITLLLLSSKGIIIDGFPGLKDEARAFAGSVFDYVLNITGVLVAIASIVMGVDNKTNRPTS